MEGLCRVAQCSTTAPWGEVLMYKNAIEMMAIEGAQSVF